MEWSITTRHDPAGKYGAVKIDENDFDIKYMKTIKPFIAPYKGCAAALAKKALLLSFIAPYGPFQVFSEKLPYVPSYRKLR